MNSTTITGPDVGARRANTHLTQLDGDHFVHTTDPEGFGTAVKDFLDTLG